jgi:chromosome segregation ATPase
LLGRNWKDETSVDKSLHSALSELNAAINGLENAIDTRLDREREAADVEGEVKRVHIDRSRLAQELDQAEFRANRLEEVNREVSSRLVTAMETIRAVLDR